MHDTLAVRLVADRGGIDMVTIISLAVAVGGVLFGAYQFFIQRRWKRIKYLDALVKRLREEPLLNMATTMIDYDRGYFTLEGRDISYDNNFLRQALRDHHESPGGVESKFQPDEFTCRKIFDAFFDYCQSIEYAINLGMVSTGDVCQSPAVYYFRRILERDEVLNGLFMKYTKAYGFELAGKLFQDCRTGGVRK